jgi:hypothetical protein
MLRIRLRYLTLKCRAFVSIFSSRLSVRSALPASFAAPVSSDSSLRFASSISSRSRLISRERSVFSVNFSCSNFFRTNANNESGRTMVRRPALRQTCRLVSRQIMGRSGGQPQFSNAWYSFGIARDACAGNATAGRDPRLHACDRGHAWRLGTLGIIRTSQIIANCLHIR